MYPCTPTGRISSVATPSGPSLTSRAWCWTMSPRATQQRRHGGRQMILEAGVTLAKRHGSMSESRPAVAESPGTKLPLTLPSSRVGIQTGAAAGRTAFDVKNDTRALRRTLELARWTESRARRSVRRSSRTRANEKPLRSRWRRSRGHPVSSWSVNQRWCPARRERVQQRLQAARREHAQRWGV